MAEEDLVDVYVTRRIAATAAGGVVPARDTIPNHCYDLCRVELRDARPSPDGRYLVSLFRAPDAESVRRLLRRAGVPFDRVWTAE